MTDQLTQDYRDLAAQAVRRAAQRGPQALANELDELPLSLALEVLSRALCAAVAGVHS